MANLRLQRMLSAVVVATVFCLALVAMMSVTSVHAQGVDRPESPPAASVEPMQTVPEPALGYHIWLTTILSVQITDLGGVQIGEGTHGGEVLCRNKCSQSTDVDFDNSITSIRYRFTTRQATDPASRRVVVAGKGTIQKPGKDDKFTFLATFQDNRDGTISARYEASMPEASLIVPNSPGKMVFLSQ